MGTGHSFERTESNDRVQGRKEDKKRVVKDLMREHIENVIANKSRQERVGNIEARRATLDQEIRGLIEDLVSEKRADDGTLINSNNEKRAKLIRRLEAVNEKFEKSKVKSSFLKNRENQTMKALGHFPRSISQMELIRHITYLEEFMYEIQHERNKQQAWIDMHTSERDPNISLLIQYVEKAYEIDNRPMQKWKDCVNAVGEIRGYLSNKITKIIEANEGFFDDNEKNNYRSKLLASKRFFDGISPGALFLSDKPKFQSLGYIRRVDTYKDLIRHLKSLEKLREGILAKVRRKEGEEDITGHTRGYTTTVQEVVDAPNSPTTSRAAIDRTHLNVLKGHHQQQSSDVIDTVPVADLQASNLAPVDPSLNNS